MSLVLIRRLLGQVLGASSAISALLAQSFFVPFALAVFAAMARIQVRRPPLHNAQGPPSPLPEKHHRASVGLESELPVFATHLANETGSVVVSLRKKFLCPVF